MIMEDNNLAEDKMEEECGIFGVYSKEVRDDIMGLGYYGLFALQHRGQESAGLTVSNMGVLETIKGMGLVSEVFTDKDLTENKGNALIGHVRYSTTGSSSLMNAQPLGGYFMLGQFAIAHNGNLVNTATLRRQLESESAVFQTTTDTELILNLLSRYSRNGIKSMIVNTMKTIKGSFALVMLIGDKLIGVRDPNGIRPLCLGKINGGTYVLASETCALDTVDAKFIRDIEPGEIVIIDSDGVDSIKYEKNSSKAPCSFEYIYFARPDTKIDGIDVYSVRHQTGKYLYRQNPIEADVVIGVPDSGIPAAIGYSEESKIPYGIGLVKNKYIGRTFISPSQELREKSVKVKLNAIKKVVEGKRVVVIDDSLVRGTTSKKLVKMLREAGAKEVHFRSASPVVKNECYFGIDIATKKELIGSKMSLEEIREKIDADSLDYLTLENLKLTLGGTNFCMGCFTGNYPITDMENKSLEDEDADL
ncbi:Amidophosphoribosyltransferase precursor [Sebaldella termitidis]|uniref:Amidophosphoribosyltransferase n=1 Tax=Sebaldella termitidis (strain ATCC 33386 / NCTC 11300) TaxID=526218 RepID=D1AK47_SEBTE|nr:amidophosphoribosyltransferase [Sebaldella termitidis]ACZ08963.1 amidophosphoribosyltransferase [Sebaldella termitidis ATCC 33386]SUI24282.1 Amidophosphoribosyltransferase precursor [Sebaldella termitidis]